MVFAMPSVNGSKRVASLFCSIRQRFRAFRLQKSEPEFPHHDLRVITPGSSSAFSPRVFSVNQRRQRYTIPRYLHRSTSLRLPQEKKLEEP